ncbi:MAG: ketoacyl-ACP synthase III [Alphaproteobacteria bacterium]|nr:ketoacyl-ACP synthase III [Alphaproteobacteria bacterium]
MTIGSIIKGIGGFLPEKIMTNIDLAKVVETNDEWIQTRTGIKQRHIAEKEVYASDLGAKAAEFALKDAGIQASEIDAVIVATTTPDLTFPSTATIIQSKIGAKNAFAFDVQAVCSGFIYALTIADALIKNNNVKNVLVIGTETMSKIVNWEDRATCVLFGDGAGAVILSGSNDNTKGIIASDLRSDGDYLEILRTTASFYQDKGSNYLTMKGTEVFKHAVEKMSSSVSKCLNKANLSIGDVDVFVPHQANIRIINSVGEKLGIDDSKVIKTVDLHANTSAATIPLALDHAKKAGMLKSNQNILMTAIGGGLAWGSLIIRS